MEWPYHAFQVEGAHSFNIYNLPSTERSMLGVDSALVQMLFEIASPKAHTLNVWSTL